MGLDRRSPISSGYLLQRALVVLFLALPLGSALVARAASPMDRPGVVRSLSTISSNGAARPRRVLVAGLPTGAGPGTLKPPALHPSGLAAFQRAKMGSRTSLQSALVPGQARRVAEGMAEQSIIKFPATSYDAQINQLGGDQATEPPDSQIAAGPAAVLLLTNASGSIYAKDGTLINRFDLTTFFGLPPGYYFGDPRVFYDAGSGRWLASGVSFDGRFDSQVYVAVSATTDPAGAWQVFTIAQNTQQTLYDQPKLGYSDDKVVISWTDYANGATSYSGQETRVLQKSDLLAGQAPAFAANGPDPSHFDLVPAQMLGSSSAIYLVYNDADPYLAQNQSYPALGVIAVSGTPADGNVTWTETDLRVNATSVPPPATQLGSAATLDTNDDRLLFAVWQGGVLWTGGNDSCVPTGDSSPRACARLFRVSTSPALGVSQDFDVGQNQAYLYFPSITLDGAGDAFVSATESSPGTYASAVTFVQDTRSPAGATGPLQVVEAGLGVYDCGSGCANGGSARWGDYSGSSPDPGDPTTVWIAAEYAASTQHTLDWGVGVARVGLASVKPGDLGSPGSGTRLYFPVTG